MLRENVFKTNKSAGKAIRELDNEKGFIIEPLLEAKPIQKTQIDFSTFETEPSREVVANKDILGTSITIADSHMPSIDATPWTENSVLKDSHLLSKYPDLGINRQEFSLMQNDAEANDPPFKTPLINVPKRKDNLWI